MTFSEAIKEYTDEFGLVHPDKSHSSQNGLTYLAYILALKVYLEELDGRSKGQLDRAVYACSKRPGLICRVPGPAWGYQEGPDDYISVLCASRLAASDIGTKMFLYGITHLLEVGPFRFEYFYNTDNPETQFESSGKKNWPAYFGRFPLFRVLLKWACDRPRTRLDRLIFATDCLWTACLAKQSDDTPLMMLFLKLQAFGSYRMKTLCTRILNMRKITYKKAFELYFKESHPLAQYFLYQNPWGEK